MPTSTIPADNKRTPRRWTQFRLRTLLLVPLVVAVPLAWVALHVQRYRAERAAVAELQAMGANVTNGEDLGPVWLRDWLGERCADYFHT
ncbi:MAG TPA: hypothetical protein VGJ26_04070, partial [Pirellulales bacterium]